MKKSRPYKDKPWIVMETTGFLESLFFGGRTRMYVDTTHPEWWSKVMIPTAKKLNEMMKKMNK